VFPGALYRGYRPFWLQEAHRGVGFAGLSKFSKDRLTALAQIVNTGQIILAQMFHFRY
jgi:hypothetical protein